jgi:hypothetical protein
VCCRHRAKRNDVTPRQVYRGVKQPNIGQKYKDQMEIDPDIVWSVVVEFAALFDALNHPTGGHSLLQPKISKPWKTT